VRTYYGKFAVVVRIKLVGTGVAAFRAMLNGIWDDVRQAFPGSQPLIRAKPVWRDEVDGDLRLCFFLS